MRSAIKVVTRRKWVWFAFVCEIKNGPIMIINILSKGALIDPLELEPEDAISLSQLSHARSFWQDLIKDSVILQTRTEEKNLFSL